MKSESVEIKDDLVFNLHIGANLRELGEPLEQAVGSIGSDRSFRIFIYYKDEAQTYQAYAISFYVTAEEKNRYFYSDESGRMYYKDTDKLVDAFSTAIETASPKTVRQNIQTISYKNG